MSIPVKFLVPEGAQITRSVLAIPRQGEYVTFDAGVRFTERKLYVVDGSPLYIAGSPGARQAGPSILVRLRPWIDGVDGVAPDVPRTPEIDQARPQIGAPRRELAAGDA